MTNEREELIRRRAHELWEQEGRPHGRHEHHWQQALREVGMDADESSSFDALSGTTADPDQAAPAKGRKRRIGAVAEAVMGDSGLDSQVAEPKRRSARRGGAAAAEADGTRSGTDSTAGRRATKAANGAGTDGADKATPRRARKPKAEAGTDGPAQS